MNQHLKTRLKQLFVISMLCIMSITASDTSESQEEYSDIKMADVEGPKNVDDYPQWYYVETSEYSGNESYSDSEYETDFSIEETDQRDFVLDEKYQVGTIPLLNRKVHRGNRASIFEFPFMVSIRRNLAHYVTGVIITDSVVLTVAHPVYKVPVYDLVLVFGENYSDRGAEMVDVVLCIIHEDFNPYTLQGDIAMLIARNVINFKLNLKIVVILSNQGEIRDIEATVIGWGRCDLTGKELCLPRSTEFYPNEIVDPMLRSVNFVLGESQHCSIYLKKMNLTIYPGMFCAGVSRLQVPTVPCMAVPGAPFIVFSYLVGLQSWGYGCGYRQDLPLVYTDVRYYTEWLKHNLEVFNRLADTDLRSFYIAAQSYIKSRSLRILRNLPPLLDNGARFLELDQVDYVISNVNGTVYDYRDFIFDGNYSVRKQELYEEYRNITLYKKLLSLYNQSRPDCGSFMNEGFAYFLDESKEASDAENNSAEE